MKQSYKAYIAANKETKAFDSAYGETPQKAIAAVKRKNSTDWKDCHVWSVFVYEDGQEERVDG